MRPRIAVMDTYAGWSAPIVESKLVIAGPGKGTGPISSARIPAARRGRVVSAVSDSAAPERLLWGFGRSGWSESAVQNRNLRRRRARLRRGGAA
jgi:hypothetical protein